jgi:hypothetical protein
MLGLPVTLVGAALLIAQAIARWMTYVVYRNSAAWPLMPDRLHRLMLLTIVFLAMLPTVEVTTQSPWPIALVFGWGTIFVAGLRQSGVVASLVLDGP